MRSKKLEIARIGKFRGVRLPAATLRRYRIGESVIMEETAEGILLRPTGRSVVELAWRETAREMAASAEDWSDWDTTGGDGLAQIPWTENDRAVEAKARNRPERSPRKAR